MYQLLIVADNAIYRDLTSSDSDILQEIAMVVLRRLNDYGVYDVAIAIYDGIAM